jgi:hypothetical protein
MFMPPPGRVSHVWFVVCVAQSESIRHWTQRLLGASQTVFPMPLVAQLVVPHAMTQVLVIVLHVAPAGQFVSARHCTHRSAGSMVSMFARVSHTLFVAWLEQSESIMHWTHRLLVKSQIWAAVHPIGDVPQGVRASGAPLSETPPLPAEPADPPEPAEPPDPAEPPVAEPPEPVVAPLPPVPVLLPPEPPEPAVPVLAGLESSPPQAA